MYQLYEQGGEYDILAVEGGRARDCLPGGHGYGVRQGDPAVRDQHCNTVCQVMSVQKDQQCSTVCQIMSV